MVTIKQALDDLNRSELTPINGNDDIGTTSGELIILIQSLKLESSEYVVGRDCHGNDIHIGDRCWFRTDISRPTGRYDDNGEAIYETNNERIMGVVVYDNDTCAYAFETEDDYVPMLLMHVVDKDSIENISSQGADDSKICNWIRYDYRSICPSEHGVYWRIPNDTESLRYCPHCGKPIYIDGVPLQTWIRNGGPSDENY